jgi:hypothetical protein
VVELGGNLVDELLEGDGAVFVEGGEVLTDLVSKPSWACSRMAVSMPNQLGESPGRPGGFRACCGFLTATLR